MVLPPSQSLCPRTFPNRQLRLAPPDPGLSRRRLHPRPCPHPKEITSPFLLQLSPNQVSTSSPTSSRAQPTNCSASRSRDSAALPRHKLKPGGSQHPARPCATHLRQSQYPSLQRKNRNRQPRPQGGCHQSQQFRTLRPPARSAPGQVRPQLASTRQRQLRRQPRSPRHVPGSSQPPGNLQPGCGHHQS